MGKIGIIDSGMGGLTTLHSIVSLCTPHEFIYLADTANAPYGRRNETELCDILRTLTLYLESLGAEIIIYACNTATAAAKDIIAKESRIKLIGAEPAIMPAASTIEGKIAVLATSVTAFSGRMEKLIVRSGRKEDISIFPRDLLAMQIEAYAPDFHNMLGYISEAFSFLNNFDALVLGCTHFILIKKVFQQAFPHIKIFDGNEGIARRVCAIIPASSDMEKSTLRIIATGRNKTDKYYAVYRSLG